MSFVSYEWDPKKAASNLSKRGVDFADAATVFDDENAITMKDDHTDEDRYVSIAMDAMGRVLVVVYTWREDNIRIISARKSTPRERRQYEKAI